MVWCRFSGCSLQVLPLLKSRDVTGHQGCSFGTRGRDCFSKWSVHCRFCVSLFSLTPSNTLALCVFSSTTCLSGGSLATLTSWPFTTLWTWSTCSTVTALSQGVRGPWRPKPSTVSLLRRPSVCVSTAPDQKQNRSHTQRIESDTLSVLTHGRNSS